MTASRSRDFLPRRRHRLALVGFAALALLPIAGAGAQDQGGAQPPLAPANQPPALQPPTPLLPFDPTARQPEGAGPAADAPQVQGIEINRLSAIEPDGLGLLEAENGGLGEDLWADSDRERVVGLLALLPDRYRSAVLRDLARRLLLSRATGPGRAAAPLGGLAAQGAAEPDLGLLVLRVDRLGKIGDSEALARLLDIVPRRFDEEPITRARVESALLLGDLGGGCGEVRKGLPLYFSVPYWQKALIACQLVAGETEQAQLGLGLLTERGLDEDAAFFALAAALTGAEAEVPAAYAAQPLPFALLQARGQVLPPGSAQEAGLGVLVAMALSSKTGLEQRSAAAERATAAGALDPAELGRIYDAFSFELAELDGPALPDLALPRGRALAYQRALRALGPAAQAAAMASALNLVWSLPPGDDDAYRPLAAALQPLVSRLPRAPQTLAQASVAGRALYAAGRPEEGGAWLDYAQQVAAVQPEAAGAAIALWPYWRLAGGRTAVLGGGIASWQATQGHADPAALGRRVTLLRALLGGLESGWQASPARTVPTPGQLAGSVPADGLPGARPGDLPAELASAAAAGRRGETVLLALAVLGGEPLDRAEPATLAAVLAALSRAGFEGEARALAIETALAARI